MKYLLMKNVAVVELIERKKEGGVEYENYGLSSRLNRKYAAQGHTLAGEFCSLFPINDLSMLESKMDSLQQKVLVASSDQAYIEVVDDATVAQYKIDFKNYQEVGRIAKFEKDNECNITTNILLAQLIDEIKALRVDLVGR